MPGFQRICLFGWLFCLLFNGFSQTFWIPPGQNLQGEMVPYTSFARNQACDDCSESIDLPFDINFYGQNTNRLYLNANGNLSLGQRWTEFTPEPFCLQGPALIAPFYADVDLSVCGSIQHYTDQHSLIVIWEDVCHYLAQDSATDLTNRFQVILTDGSIDSILGQLLPSGTNLIFSYQEMQWTSGHSSGGDMGLAGEAATVGLNDGSGERCFQLGRFDRAGHDAPTDHQAGGVSWLDGKSFFFHSGLALPVDQIEAEVGEALIIDSLMKVEAFPNPFSQQISVATNFSQAESAEMLLTDMAGHIIFQETITTAAGRQIHQIRPGALAHGMYCLRLRWGQKQWHQILIKN